MGWKIYCTEGTYIIIIKHNKIKMLIISIYYFTKYEIIEKLKKVKFNLIINIPNNNSMKI